MDKPFHMLTQAEKTALRIAQNKAITERVVEKQEAEQRAGREQGAKTPRRRAASANGSSSRVKPQPPPEKSTTNFTRSTPEERAEVGAFIRKVQS